jgi:NitT/TauT family transport system permease protein
MPKVALAPLFVIWFGFGMTTNIIYTALVAFFPVLVNFVQGLEDVNLSEQRLMASYNASKWQIFRHVHLYRSLPYIFAGLKMAAVLALIGAVVSEFVAGDGGLGYYMVQTQNLLRTKEAFAALIILTLMGLVFYLAIDVLHRLLMPWARDTEVGDQNVL